MTHTPEMPSDCPQVADVLNEAGTITPEAFNALRDYKPYVSYLLTLKPRTFAQAVRDVSKHRDLDDWVWDELAIRRQQRIRPQIARVISMAAERAKRRVK